MRENIHPEYRKVAFRDSSTQDVFVIGSTLKSDKSITIDGIEYPLIVVDVTSASHPFYTGKQKFAQAEGRISRFNKKYGLDENNDK